MIVISRHSPIAAERVLSAVHDILLRTFSSMSEGCRFHPQPKHAPCSEEKTESLFCFETSYGGENCEMWYAFRTVPTNFV